MGIATGLAWTATGGDVLFIEATAMKGQGQAHPDRPARRRHEGVGPGRAVATRAPAPRQFGIQDDFFATHDIHVHVPEGAIPKDGPSAGITMATAMISVFTSRPVRRVVAMTGEITLRGNVLPIGGLKEKILAARRAGITTIICPKLNKKELDEVPAHLRRGMEFHLVDDVDEVLSLALLPSAPEHRRRPPGPKAPPKAFPAKPRRPVVV